MRFLGLLVIGMVVCPAQNAKQLPEGPGRKTTERLCGSCHGFGNFMRKRDTREGWNNVIEDMIRRGAKGEEEEWAEVSDYLVAQFSPVRVNVNQATAAQIAEGLQVKAAVAAAIVKHREGNGAFKSFEDLGKVAGVDAAALEARRMYIDY
jgi:competence protein ComEA